MGKKLIPVFVAVLRKLFSHSCSNNVMDITSEALFRLEATGFLVPTLLLITVLSLLYYSQYKQWAKYSKIPGPRPLPFLGNLHQFIAYEIDVLRITSNIYKKFNDMFIVWVGCTPLVAISNPEHLRVFYTNTTMIDRANTAYDDIAEFLGKDNIFCASGDQWKKVRKMLMTNFHPMPNETFLKNFLIAQKIIAQSFRKKADGTTFSCQSMVKKMFLGSILLSTTGKKLSEDQTVKFMNEVDFAMRVAYIRQAALHLRNDLIFQFMPSGRRFKKDLRSIHKLVSDLVEEKKVEMQRMVENGEEIPNLYIYNMLRKFGHESLDLIKFELLNLLVTGMDTTSNTICFTLLICGLYPEIQERIYQEDQEVMKSLAGNDLEVTDLEKYKFLDRVIKETLRLFPVGPIIGRKLGEDTYFGDILVPKGTEIAALAYLTYRRAELFPDPLKFDPDRFLPENVEKLHPYAYNPFSAGPRGCPGKRYAHIGMKTIVSAIVREFVIKTHYSSMEELLSNAQAEITLNDRNGYPIRFLPRRARAE